MSFRKTYSPLALVLLSACGVSERPESTPTTATTTSTTTHALACATYAVTDLGIPDGGAAAVATTLDDDGNVAGNWRPTTGAEPTHAFRWNEVEGFVDIATLGGTWATAYGIRGHRVVGESKLANGDSHAYLADDDGVHDLGTLGGAGVDASRARAINSAGVIVGESRNASGQLRAAGYSLTASPVDLGAVGGSTTASSAAYAISNAGIFVGSSGSRAAKWVNGVATDLGTLTGSTTVANAVNNNGVAAGNLVTNWSPRPAKFDNGVVTDLGLLSGFERGTGLGINDAGYIVGSMQHQSGEGPGVQHGYLYDGAQLHDLNDLVAGSGWTIGYASAINNNGQIAGWGYLTNPGMGGDNRQHALLLTPTCNDLAPAFVSVSTVTNDTTVDAPADIQAGDFLIAALEWDEDPALVTPPAGWTLVADQLTGEGTYAAFHALVYTHVATANEPESYTFAAANDVYVDIQIAAYRGTTGIQAIASSAATASSIAAPSLTTTQANERLIAIFIDFEGGVWTVAPGMTERASFDSNSLQDEVRPVAGPTGTRTASDTTGAMAAISIALQ